MRFSFCTISSNSPFISTYLPVAGHRNKYMKMSFFIFLMNDYTLQYRKFFISYPFSRRSTNTFLSSKGVMICCIVKNKTVIEASHRLYKMLFNFFSVMYSSLKWFEEGILSKSYLVEEQLYFDYFSFLTHT